MALSLSGGQIELWSDYGMSVGRSASSYTLNCTT